MKQEYIWNQERQAYWLSLLGENLMKKIFTHSNGMEGSFSKCAYKNKVKFEEDNMRVFLEQWLDMDNIEVFSDITFSSFYVPLSAYAVMMLREQLLDKSDCYAESVFEDFQKTCVNQLQAICVRTMILRMHEQKQAGNLFGDTSAEEYMDFNARILNSAEFIQDTFWQFPEIYRCVTELLEDLVVYYAEIIDNYQHEYDDIKRVLQIPDGEIKIIHIETGLGDGHNRGRQVVKITLEQGTSFLYKPHSMENDEAYYKLLSWLEKGTHISQKYVPLVSYKNHGWCGIVSTDTCKTRQELEQYYERFGVHLFLTWILGTRDLHFENVIASGAYPVMVDLEVLLSANDNKAQTMQDAVLMELSKSVLFSGLLPYYHWNKEGEGIDGSALGGKDGQVYPFKIPTIVDDKTSNMRVEYIHPVTHAANNLATLQGDFVSPARYEAEIHRGFMMAYQAVVVDKDAFLQEAEILQNVRIRYLVADTQRYSMLLNSSYHPSLLRDPIEREIFLHAIWMGRDDAEAPMVAYEVQSMAHGDIPLFYCAADECALCADGEVIVEDYFSRSAYQMFVDRMNGLNISEIEKQQDSISLALRMINDGEYRYLNKIYSAPETDEEFDFAKTMTKKQEEMLARILKYAVWNDTRTEVGWYTVHMGEGKHMTWSLAPMDMYLYDGLAGMLLILESVRLQGTCEDVSEYVKVLRQMLFHYTEQGMKEPDSLNSVMTGAFEGEGSVLHTYLLLYHMTGMQEYLEYAKKHAQIVIGLLEKDARYDMLAGNAAGCRTAYIGDEKHNNTITVHSLLEFVDKVLVKEERKINGE